MTVKPRERLWRAIREMAGSQRTFAQLVQMDEALVSKVVTGRMNLDEIEQTRWARVLKRRPDEIFGEET